MRRLLSAALLAACVLTGCTRGTVTPDPSTLRVALQEEPDSLNPALANLAISNDPIALIYDGLVKYDGSGRVVPDLALQVPSKTNGGISPDGKVITYHLRRNVRWQDGAPFTSRDVQFTWRALMDKRNNVPATAGYDEITGVRTPDRYTVQLVLRRPYAPVLSLFNDAKQGAILPSHLPFNAAPIGTGPYRLIAWHHGDALEFAANPYYWRRPHFGHVVLRPYSDESSATNALLSGDVDAVLGVHPSQLPRLERKPRVTLASRSTFHWEHLTFNLRPGSGPQANAHVRRAIAYAIDIARLNNTVLHEPPQNAPLDQAPLSWARDPAIRHYPLDLRRAREELRLSGYRSVSLTISSTAESAMRRAIEVQLQQMLRDAGITLNIKNESATLLLSRAADGGPLFGGKFQLALFAYETPTSDPDDERYVAAAAIPPNGLNVAAYRNAAVDRLLAMGQSTYDVRRRRFIYQQIQRHLIADLPFYTLAWTPEIVAYRTGMHGVEPAPIGSDLWNVASWSR